MNLFGSLFDGFIIGHFSFFIHRQTARRDKTFITPGCFSLSKKSALRQTFSYKRGKIEQGEK
ncbi:hypothetical protein, partial [Pseudoflavonifractor sp. 524-17]|uniref:hypothetical protein n=1 Tax=Pseudoflavonifractor sp. 524-17 TaxID=2304577 RepID=UPI001A9C11DD